MVDDILLFWHDYRYMPYEKYMAHREVLSLLNPNDVLSIKSGLRVTGDIPADELKRLVYFRGFQVNGTYCSTLQHNLEKSNTTNGAKQKQSTRYSVHGMHEYKGKFNPQIVRGILNILDIHPASVVFDPFCGSGTTLVECSHERINAVGCDINPLAVLISNAKLSALSIPAGELRLCFENILKLYFRTIGNWRIEGGDSKRQKYLQNWFTPDILLQIECLKAAILENTNIWQDIFLALASDLVRDYSLQEPEDLRIRRRYSPMPTQPIIDAFQKKTTQFLHNLEAAQSVVGILDFHNQAYLTDSKTIGNSPQDWSYKPPYDAALTSPPYVTALPYIDTQRLSLVWLDLCDPSEINSTEAKLTGSREFVNGEQKVWAESLINNNQQIPVDVYEYCITLQNAIAKTDGFRRTAMPSLLYRYFSDMQKVFKSVLGVVKENAPFALVVGHNHTTLGGTRFDIDTPDLLKKIAVQCGWLQDESITLQTYQRYGLHMTNAVRAETLLILRKP